MDLESDRAELKRLWYDDPVDGDAISDVLDTWDAAGRLAELLSALQRDEDPRMRLWGAQESFAIAYSPTPPPEAIETLERIAASLDEPRRTNAGTTTESYANRARSFLAGQLRPFKFDASDVAAIADVLRSAATADAGFVTIGPGSSNVSRDAIVIADTLRTLVATAVGGRVALSWFLAVNVLEFLDACGDENHLSGGRVEYMGEKMPAAAQLGAVVYETLRPTDNELAQYRSPILLLWSWGWEIVG